MDIFRYDGPYTNDDALPASGGQGKYVSESGSLSTRVRNYADLGVERGGFRCLSEAAGDAATYPSDNADMAAPPAPEGPAGSVT